MAEGIHGGLPQRRSGWFAMVVAVGVLLIILGVWNAIDGLRALVAGDFVVADAQRVVALQVAALGWVLLESAIPATTSSTATRRGSEGFSPHRGRWPRRVEQASTRQSDLLGLREGLAQPSLLLRRQVRREQ
jgi:hypothetical protein